MKDTKDFQERYNRWKNGERYWDIRGVELPKYDTGKYVTVEKDDGSVYNVNPNVANSSEITVTTPEVEVVAQKPQWMIDRDDKIGQIIPTQYTLREDNTPLSSQVDKFIDKYKYKTNNVILSGLANAADDWRRDRSPLKAASRYFGWRNPIASVASAILDDKLNTRSNTPKLIIPEMIMDYGNKYGAAVRGYNHLMSKDGLEKTMRYYDILRKSNAITDPNYAGKFYDVVASGIGDVVDATLLHNATNKVINPTFNKLRNYILSSRLNNNIRRWDGTVGMEYFNSPNNWYRWTETPEIEGIREVGKNVTTRDASDINVPSNNWRTAAMDNYSKSKEGYWYKADIPDEDMPLKEYLDYLKNNTNKAIGSGRKYGSAHGNKSQASYGKAWDGSLSTSGIGQLGLLEGQVGTQIPFGKTRTSFTLTPIEEVPIGGRVGFSTGEMPMDNLGWFTKLPNGRFKYNGQVLPYKRIEILENQGKGRYQFDKPTYQVYTGSQHDISEVINNMTINLPKLIKIQNEALKNIPNGTIARHRLENQKWHPTDWNTFLHTRDVYKRALQYNYPEEALFPALMHDAGKLWTGDGHGPYGASIIQQIFPKASKEQIQAIYGHMDNDPVAPLTKLVKGVDIKEPNKFRYLYEKEK